MARRGDADRLPAREQVRDQPARRPRLPRPGRPLDHEVAAVEPEHELLHLVELGRLHGPVERLAAEDRLERRVAAVAGEERAAEPFERRLLLGRQVRVARDQRLRQRHVGELRAALEHEPPRLAVELEDLAGALARGRVGHALPLAELVLLRREREHVRERALLLFQALPRRLELPDRLRVLDELLRRQLEPVEEGPPDRLALAVVVVEQLRRQLLARVEQLARSSARSCLRSGSASTRPARAAGTARTARAPRRAARAASRAASGRDAVLAVVLVDLRRAAPGRASASTARRRRSRCRRPSPPPAARSRGTTPSPSARSRAARRGGRCGRRGAGRRRRRGGAGRRARPRACRSGPSAA